jgi:hypothetical protein
MDRDRLSEGRTMRGPDFDEADIYMEEVGDAEADFPELDDWAAVWKVTVVVMPGARTLATEVFPYRGTALARVRDFEWLLAKKDTKVRIRRHILS